MSEPHYWSSRDGWLAAASSEANTNGADSSNLALSGSAALWSAEHMVRCTEIVREALGVSLHQPELLTTISNSFLTACEEEVC